MSVIYRISVTFSKCNVPTNFHINFLNSSLHKKITRIYRSFIMVNKVCNILHTCIINILNIFNIFVENFFLLNTIDNWQENRISWAVLNPLLTLELPHQPNRLSLQFYFKIPTSYIFFFHNDVMTFATMIKRII